MAAEGRLCAADLQSVSLSVCLSVNQSVGQSVSQSSK